MVIKEGPLLPVGNPEAAGSLLAKPGRLGWE
jgi:hypothetical protein